MKNSGQNRCAGTMENKEGGKEERDALLWHLVVSPPATDYN